MSHTAVCASGYSRIFTWQDYCVPCSSGSFIVGKIFVWAVETLWILSWVGVSRYSRIFPMANFGGMFRTLYMSLYSLSPLGFEIASSSTEPWTLVAAASCVWMSAGTWFPWECITATSVLPHHILLIRLFSLTTVYIQLLLLLFILLFLKRQIAPDEDQILYDSLVAKFQEHEQALQDLSTVPSRRTSLGISRAMLGPPGTSSPVPFPAPPPSPSTTQYASLPKKQLPLADVKPPMSVDEFRTHFIQTYGEDNCVLAASIIDAISNIWDAMITVVHRNCPGYLFLGIARDISLSPVSNFMPLLHAVYLLYLPKVVFFTLQTVSCKGAGVTVNLPMYSWSCGEDLGSATAVKIIAALLGFAFMISVPVAVILRFKFWGPIGVSEAVSRLLILSDGYRSRSPYIQLVRTWALSILPVSVLDQSATSAYSYALIIQVAAALVIATQTLNDGTTFNIIEKCDIYQSVFAAILVMYLSFMRVQGGSTPAEGYYYVLYTMVLLFLLIQFSYIIFAIIYEWGRLLSYRYFLKRSHVPTIQLEQRSWFVRLLYKAVHRFHYGWASWVDQPLKFSAYREALVYGGYLRAGQNPPKPSKASLAFVNSGMTLLCTGRKACEVSEESYGFLLRLSFTFISYYRAWMVQYPLLFDQALESRFFDVRDVGILESTTPRRKSSLRDAAFPIDDETPVVEIINRWFHSLPKGLVAKRTFIYHSWLMSSPLLQRPGFQTEVCRQMVHELWKLGNDETFEFIDVSPSELSYAVKCMSLWEPKLLAKFEVWYNDLKNGAWLEEEKICEDLQRKVNHLLERVEDIVEVEGGVRRATSTSDNLLTPTVSLYFQLVERLTRLSIQESTKLEDLLVTQTEALDAVIRERRRRLTMAGKTRFDAVEVLTMVRNEIQASKLPLDPLKAARLWDASGNTARPAAHGKSIPSRVAIKLPNDQYRLEVTQSQENIDLAMGKAPVRRIRYQQDLESQSQTPIVKMDSTEILEEAFGQDIDLLMDYLDGIDNEIAEVSRVGTKVFPTDPDEFITKMRQAVMRRHENRVERLKKIKKPPVLISPPSAQVIGQDELDQLVADAYIKKLGTQRLTIQEMPHDDLQHEEKEPTEATYDTTEEPDDSNFILSPRAIDAPPPVRKLAPNTIMRERTQKEFRLDAIRGVDKLYFAEALKAASEASDEGTDPDYEEGFEEDYYGDYEDVDDAFDTWERG